MPASSERLGNSPSNGYDSMMSQLYIETTLFKLLHFLPHFQYGAALGQFGWAAARALLGKAPITGQLPITIPGVAPFGAGLRR